MEGKLIKLEESKYTLVYKEGNIAWENNPAFDGTLSLKNCEAIANGYDLDELADKANGYLYFDSKKEHKALAFDDGYHVGFQEALEMFSDKKFSELDKKLDSMINYSNKNFTKKASEIIKMFVENLKVNIQKIQHPKEWDVEIEMEKCGYCEGCNKAGMLHCAHADSCGFPIETERPKLDADGCLILRRKS